MEGRFVGIFLGQRSFLYTAASREGKGNRNGMDCFELPAVWLTVATSCALAVGEMRVLRRDGGQIGGSARKTRIISAGLD